MSIIALRRMLTRQGKRAAVLFVALSMGLLAAHHAGLHGAHGGGAATAMHHDPDAPAAPPEPAADVAVICLAVLPILATATAVAATLLNRSRCAGVVALRHSARPAAPKSRLCSSRAGPRVLCVMRC